MPWRLQDRPAGPGAPGGSETPPLLLLLDRRQPLPPELSQELNGCLTPEERRRRDAYRLTDDRERFLLGRAGLRRLLGDWLGLAPQTVPLATGPRGKPFCPAGPAFNVSHSGDLILLAVHPCRPVGVDVERLRPALNWQAIARRMLTPAELARITSLREPERPQAFLTSWCRLEARLKARGDGLAGLERLRCETSIHAAAGAPGGSAEPGGDPLPAGAQPDREPAASPLQPEVIWDVAVPDGYRAAAALAASSGC
jgi:4'-phosphopantetheinyl transferase